ncbi:MAG: HigA family addiction module antidote protein [Deltaproteobacteria bacterium]|nr:HigA family addiction module antidote protein [Deltaproteobacteria bacterium]
MKNRKLPPIHPGEILIAEFLKPMGISQYRLAKDISVPPRRINEIVHGKRSISADTALRLGRFFGISPQFWLNLQTRFDLEVTEDLLAERLEKEVQVLSSNRISETNMAAMVAIQKS